MRQIPPTYHRAGAAAACAVLLATACSAPAAHTSANTRHGSAPGTATGAPPVASPAASGTGARTSSPAPDPTPSAGLRLCPTSALRASLGTANGAAGSIYYPLKFRNVSGTACTMFGYPGVSFVTGVSGRELGGAAVRNPTFAPHAVSLDPGATAHATLQVVIAQNYPRSICDPVTAHWLRVYPPDQLAPLYVRFTAVTCTGNVAGGSTLGIYVVRRGATGP
jgi:Protein of unknown function (DUF4232)